MAFKKKTETEKPKRLTPHVPMDVYTALLGVSAAFVLVGLIYTGYRSKELFGMFLPQLGF